MTHPAAAGLFPNLRDADLPYTCIPLFLSTSLTILIVNIPSEDAHRSLENILEDIAADAPALTTLALVASQSSGNRVKGHEQAIGTLAARLPYLTVLKLPPYYLTSTVLEMLCKSQLCALEFSELKHSADNAGDPRDVSFMSPKLELDAFPSLRRLSVCGNLRDLHGVFSHRNFPAESLSEVVVRSIRSETERDTRDLISMIVERCSSLTSFSLLMTPPANPVIGPDNENMYWVRDDDNEPIIFGTIRALSESLNLRRISIVHARPLILSDADVLHMCVSLPHLRKLALNPYPRTKGAVPPALTLLSLEHISHCCPHIRSLALYANASAPIAYPKDVTPLLACKDLQLHMSPLSKPCCTPVLQFLSRILRPGVSLRSTISHMADAWSVPIEIDPNFGWGWILERLPLLLEVRQEERDLAGAARAKTSEVMSSSAAGHSHC